MTAARQRVAVVGVHIKSDAYPNVKYKVDGLLSWPGLEVRECHFPPGGTHSFANRKSGNLLTKAGSAFDFGLAHLRALAAALRQGAGCALYIPYPAVFLLFLLSLVPRRWRPVTVQADAFISLYDTVVNDRALLSARHPLARLLRLVERRAYRSASVVWVDTALNAAHMAALFDLPPARFVALPLSINEGAYARAGYAAPDAACNVLFIGTFVPLQGVDVIADAIVLLRDHPGLRFRLIGDGQTAPKVAAILDAAGCTNVAWERNWQSADALAAEIRAADICLGVFGAGDKAQRVWPYKNYGYMAVGRALISADTPAARAMAADGSEPAWASVPAGRPDLLAAAIVALKNDPVERSRMARAAADYYRDHLSTPSSVAILAARLGAPTPQQ